MSEKDVRISYMAARTNAGLSRESAAKQLNISVFTLANYETGKTISVVDITFRVVNCTTLPSHNACPNQE